MLLSLDIENFQSWKSSHFDFHPGLNVIMGPTDNGKSAVIRCFRLLRWNRPSGSDFRSWWGGPMRITLQTTEGNKIQRIDTNSSREYIVNSGEALKAFGTDVPDEVSWAINMDEVNLQVQSDHYYLLNATPGEVARHFNKVAKLDDIDRAQSNLKSWSDKLSRDIAADEASVDADIKKLSTFDYLQKFEADVEVLEELESRFNGKSKRLIDLKRLARAYKLAQIDIDSRAKILELKPLIERLETVRANKKEVERRYGSLVGLVENYTYLQTDIVVHQELMQLEPDIQKLINLKQFHEEKTNQLRGLKKLTMDLKILQTQIEKQEKLMGLAKPLAKFTDLYNKRISVQNGLVKLKNARDKAVAAQKSYINAKAYYEKVQKEFDDNMGDSCILCGNPLKNHPDHE